MTVVKMPEDKFVAVTMGFEFNTAEFLSPFTKTAQVLEFAGARWWANLTPQLKSIEYHAKSIAAWKAFLISTKGRVNEFRVSDPALCISKLCPVKGNSTHSGVHTLPAIPGAATKLFPSDVLYPETTLHPTEDSFPESSFQLKAIVSSMHIGGSVSGKTGTACGLVDFSVSGMQTDFSMGVHPGYAAAYAQALSQLDLHSLHADPVCVGAYFNVGNEMKMITSVDNYRVMPGVDCKAAFCVDIGFEPPLRGAAGAIDFDNPGVMMHMVDDMQAQWSSSAESGTTQFQFSAIEMLCAT